MMMLNRTVLITAFSALLVSTAVWALDLQSAKQQHLVGEKPSGYVGAVISSAAIEELVSSVNTQRKQAYQAISQENNQSLTVVETFAAKKLYDKLETGEHYQAADGSWKRK